MSFDTLQESRILRKILRIVGLWVDDGEHRVPSIVVGLLIHGPLTFSYTVLMWIDVFVSSDLTQATDVLYIALTETALVVKIISILTHRRLARSIFDVWQTDDRFKLQSLEERLMWKESFATFTIVSIPYIACSLSVVGCTFAAALFTNVYRLPFSYWTPFDCHDPKYYWYAYLYGAIAMPLTCIANCTLDMWQCYMMQHLAVSFKLIATRLEKLGRSEHEPHSVVMRKLIRIIQLEQKVKSMSKQCERVVSYPILAQILLSALVLCFSLYRLKNVNFLEDPANFAALVQYAVVMTLQIFLPCYYANVLTLESSRLVHSIYCCNWINMSFKNRRMITLYSMHLNEPVILRAGNFFDIGLPIFSKTMNNAYSFFALLLNMDE